MASQITSLTIVYSIVYLRRRSKKTSKFRVTGLNSPHKGPVTRIFFPFDDVIMCDKGCLRRSQMKKNLFSPVSSLHFPNDIGLLLMTTWLPPCHKVKVKPIRHMLSNEISVYFIVFVFIYILRYIPAEHIHYKIQMQNSIYTLFYLNVFRCDWKLGVVMIPNLSSLVVPAVFMTTTSGVLSSEKVGIMNTPVFITSAPKCR